MKVVEAVVDVNEAVSQVTKNCNLLLKMIGEVNRGVKTKIEQIRSLDSTNGEHKVTAGQLDDIRDDLDHFINKVMNLKV